MSEAGRPTSQLLLSKIGVNAQMRGILNSVVEKRFFFLEA